MTIYPTFELRIEGYNELAFNCFTELNFAQKCERRKVFSNLFC